MPTAPVHAPSRQPGSPPQQPHARPSGARRQASSSWRLAGRSPARCCRCAAAGAAAACPRSAHAAAARCCCVAQSQTGSTPARHAGRERQRWRAGCGVMSGRPTSGLDIDETCPSPGGANRRCRCCQAPPHRTCCSQPTEQTSSLQRAYTAGCLSASRAAASQYREWQACSRNAPAAQGRPPTRLDVACRLLTLSLWAATHGGKPNQGS